MTAEAPYARERALAEAAVLRAAILTDRVQSVVKEVSKDDKSPVTAADFAAQALLIAALRHAFPHDGFVGEEDARQLRQDPALVSWVYDLVSSAADVVGPDGALLPSPTSVEDTLSLIDVGGRGEGGRKGRFWVMDPVDGTKTFLRRQQYAVSLALVEDGREVVGVLCCPNLRLRPDGHVSEDSVDVDGLGMMLSAVRGQGVTVRNLSGALAATPGAAGYSLPPSRPLGRLCGPRDLRSLHIVDSPLSTAIRHDVIEELAAQLGTRYPGTEVWSSHMRYASLILGGADCQIRVPAKRADGSPPSKVCIWDHAGTQLIFTEAGGLIADLDGKDIDFGAGRHLSNNRGMIVAREGVHEKICTMIKAMIER